MLQRIAKSLIVLILALSMARPSSANLTLTYEPLTSEDLNAVWERYGSIPAGVTLEGLGDGIPAANLRYDASQNAFIFDNGLIYRSPVASAELNEIIASLEKEDALGFSAENEGTIYGVLPESSRVAGVLQKLDFYLGKRALAKAQPAAGGTAVHFKFDEYRFEPVNGKLKLAGAKLKISLIPLQKGKTLSPRRPDASRAINPHYENNVRRLIQNYNMLGGREDLVGMAARYGEAAAFLRTIKSQGTDLGGLIDSLNDEMRAALLVARSA